MADGLFGNAVPRSTFQYPAQRNQHVALVFGDGVVVVILLLIGVKQAQDRFALFCRCAVAHDTVQLPAQRQQRIDFLCGQGIEMAVIIGIIQPVNRCTGIRHIPGNALENPAHGCQQIPFRCIGSKQMLQGIGVVQPEQGCILGCSIPLKTADIAVPVVSIRIGVLTGGCFRIAGIEVAALVTAAGRVALVDTGGSGYNTLEAFGCGHRDPPESGRKAGCCRSLSQNQTA